MAELVKKTVATTMQFAEESKPVAANPQPKSADTQQLMDQVEDLKRRLAEATEKVSESKKALIRAGVTEEIEQEVNRRMALGLPRETALTCARAQVRHNAALLLPDKTAAEKLAKEQAIIAAASEI